MGDFIEYSLLPEEVKLYEGDVVSGREEGRNCRFLLTNLNLVLMPVQEKRRFRKPKPVENRVIPVSQVKVYQGEPQIHARGEFVTLSLIPEEMTLVFGSSMEARKFVMAALKLLTGKSAVERGREKVEGIIGPDISNLARNVVQNGLRDTLWNGTRHRNRR